MVPRSLVVKLRCQQLQWTCEKCTIVISKWCNQPPDPLSLADWTVSELVHSSATCRVCHFFLRVLEASPWVRCSNQDIIAIRTVLVGSQHTSALERAFQDNQHSTTAYEKYYRPQLICYSSGTGGSYGPDNKSFIFPAAPTGASDSLPGQHSPYAFHGRVVGPQVDFSLIRAWFQKCASCHHGQHNGLPKNVPIRLIDEHDTSSRGCLPEIPSPIANFRLIDVQQRCVVRMSDQTEYVALSYVWGTAPRITLSRANIEYLSVPGALSPNSGNIPLTFLDAFDLVEKLSFRYLWIDALCILQDDERELDVHMGMMESVYSAAMLTVVSDNESADMGIPGMSVLRAPQQATFEFNGVPFISMRPTFAETLKASHWETRGWCLQEKLFSKRLLVFTNSQVFYHCTVSTWFEDTITEPKGNISGYVHMREKPTFSGKGGVAPGSLVMPRYTAYESHRETFGRGFWSLIEAYTGRQLSYDSDALRAFSGILRSIEPQYGPALWGLPRKDFARGLSWSLSSPRPDRRPGFPSWSWAGWRSRGDKAVSFVNYKRNDSDLGVANGKYHVSGHNDDSNAIFDLKFYHYVISTNGNMPTVKAVTDIEADAGYNAFAQNNRAREADPQAKLLSQASISKRIKRWIGKLVATPSSWSIPGHPGEKGYTNLEPPATLIAQPGMPPIEHVITFWTSVSKILFQRADEVSADAYKLIIPGSTTQIGYVKLAKGWRGGGMEHEIIYISRWCHDWYDTENNLEVEVEQQRSYSASDADKALIAKGKIPERLNLMLLERVEGWGEVRRKLQLVVAVSLSDWRAMNPQWKMVSLA